MNEKTSLTKMAVMKRSGGARKSRPDNQTYPKYDANAPLPQGEKRCGRHRGISPADTRSAEPQKTKDVGD